MNVVVFPLVLTLCMSTELLPLLSFETILPVL